MASVTAFFGKRVQNSLLSPEECVSLGVSHGLSVSKARGLCTNLAAFDAIVCKALTNQFESVANNSKRVAAFLADHRETLQMYVDLIQSGALNESILHRGLFKRVRVDVGLSPVQMKRPALTRRLLERLVSAAVKALWKSQSDLDTFIDLSLGRMLVGRQESAGQMTQKIASKWTWLYNVQRTEELTLDVQLYLCARVGGAAVALGVRPCIAPLMDELEALRHQTRHQWTEDRVKRLDSNYRACFTSKHYALWEEENRFVEEAVRALWQKS